MLVTNDRDFPDNVPRLEGVNIKKNRRTLYLLPTL